MREHGRLRHVRHAIANASEHGATTTSLAAKRAGGGAVLSVSVVTIIIRVRLKVKERWESG